MKNITFDKRFYIEDDEHSTTYVCSRGIRLWYSSEKSIEQIREEIKEREKEIKTIKEEVEIMKQCIDKFNEEFGK